MEIDDFRDLFDAYKLQFGNTFSYFDVANKNELREIASDLMQQALRGDRAAVTNADLGIVIPEDALS